MGVKTFIISKIKKIGLLAVAATLVSSYVLPLARVYAGNPPSQDYALIAINNTTTVEQKDNATSIDATFTNGKLNISGTGLYSNGTSVYAPAGSDVVLTANGASNYTGNLYVDGTNIHNSTHTLNNVVASNAPINVDAEFTLSTTQATINYTYDGNGAANISIDGTPFFDANNSGDSGSYGGDVEYTPAGNDVTFAIEPLFIKRLTALTINNTDCTTAPNFPNTPAKIMEATGDQVVHYTCTVPTALDNTYNISTTTTENHDEWMTVGNFLWSYLPQDADTDDYVGHGRLTFVKIEYDGHEYTEAQMAALNKGYMAWGEFNEGNEGGALLPAGAKITVELMPDEGYQLTSFTLNGQPFTAQEEIGTYEFEIPRGNFHLGAHFTAVDDAVATEAEAVESGTITLGDGEIDNGTARLDVKDVDLDAEDVADFEDAAGDYKVKSYLDISLFQTIYKGTATDAWDQQIRELSNEATITLKLDESIDGNEIVIVHQKHDGTYEVIPTVYDSVNHTITFKTSSFSNYAIATKTVASPDTGVMTSEGASAIESGIIPLIATIILLGLVGFVTKKLV